MEPSPLSTEIREEDIVSLHESLGKKSERSTPSPQLALKLELLQHQSWNLWISINQLIFQKRAFTPEETLLKAISEAREWMLAQLPQKAPLSKPVIGLEPNPRGPGVTSIYTDAAWNSYTGSAGFGWIIDDLVSSSQHPATSQHV
ncbi:hypothetical protein F2Q68_00012338 [Brassica cretica]|uniref:RNase H type-1 domain-containing protein n=1 Tax=Brassica cretica TaxID=69181 RepID=A0A8S9KQL7_BRACR|nr:hypothetical protein F2Q68_00012338 [Brassica cretica]